ncbi:flagellin [Cereibacter sphaeroides]|uniref:flagellin N-terminal helical domain-containing protein n=1 Tax=Cereibacter sphaeroides TaxID=1063 RepID=UPI001F458A3B|nr:flagellin [Cereibacter sphaeroides]MCE6967968.1 flagellin [Cereibacter sphaeroides]
MSSILTNTSAMVALQTLKSINSNLAKTQDEISTGKSVASAKDNAAIWSIAQNMTADVKLFESISSALGMGEATVSAALTGAEEIVTTLNEMSKLAASATSENADYDKINEQLTSLKEKIDGIVDASQFNGANLLMDTVDGTATTFNIISAANREGSNAPEMVYITVDAQDLKTDVQDATLTTIADNGTAEDVIGEIEDMRAAVLTAAATLGTAKAQITDQGTFIGKLSDSLKRGISTLGDADMEAASARLQALQVQQQLATQSLSIANQAPQNILSLFR